MRQILLTCMLFASVSIAVWAADTKADTIITLHLDSIGTQEARAAVKTRVIQGPLHFRDLTGRKGDVDGYWGYVSDGNKLNLVMKFGSGEWHGERFVFDGAKTNFAVFTSSRRPSSFGDFVHWQDFILKEGLLGGELSIGWALENLDRNRAKIDDIGLKKIDGRELNAIEYHSKGNDMNVTLYFEPETHRHVMTVYSVSWEPGIGYRTEDSARARQIRYTIEERFSDFQTDNQITLPKHYDLRYTQQPQKGETHQYEWEMTAEKTFSNVSVDPQNFQIK